MGALEREAMVTYNIIKEIGRGGFGVVEEVENSKTKEHFACKTLEYPNGASKADMKARFEREVKYQSAIDHPNVVSIVVSNLDDDPPWFVMPLAEGSLLSELRADRTLGGDPRKALFDMLAGLEEIHRLGHKHRDLSPGNVLKFRDSDGDSYYAISDFGLMSPQAGQTTTLTDTNAAGGTLPYRAPECAIDFKRATAQADIYSVGAILHDIFGTPGTRIPHTELRANGEIGEIIAKCTKTNPRRRYKNISELREALYEVLRADTLEFVSDEDQAFVNLLHENDSLTDEQWDALFSHLDRISASDQSTKAVLSALRRVHIQTLFETAPELFHALGNDYARFSEEYSFDFDFCDVVANVAQIFYDNGEIDLKANITLAMLKMGTSHNRWLVERKFIKMAAPDISEELAARIAIEVEVRDIDFHQMFEHLKDSISVSDSAIHPRLAIIDA